MTDGLLFEDWGASYGSPYLVDEDEGAAARRSSTRKPTRLLLAGLANYSRALLGRIARLP